MFTVACGGFCIALLTP
ncbi:hypothetical protein K6U43_15510 [Vibrio parahaemolyticus]|nr:hypothetical protein [Vibrio parahaemolyticus]MCG6481008.1 hypothetical protein [Vibrio parahaemolyticus]